MAQCKYDNSDGGCGHCILLLMLFSMLFSLAVGQCNIRIQLYEIEKSLTPAKSEQKAKADG